MGWDCIIFDMDGTLVDSELCGSQAICDVISDASLRLSQIESDYRGWKLADIFLHIASVHSIELPENIIDLYRARENELADELIKENPGVRETLEMLDHHICIASNAPIEKTVRSLQICQLHNYFDDRIYSAYDIEKWKPDPALFLHAAESEGFQVADCVVVEDSAAGVAAALAANMKTIFYNPNNDSHEHQGVHSIHRFEELLDYV